MNEENVDINEEEKSEESEESEEGIIEKFTDISQFKLGVSQASYFSGFAYVFKKIGFPDEAVASIVNQKIIAEYQMEMHRLTLQAQENLNEKILKAGIENGFGNGLSDFNN